MRDRAIKLGYDVAVNLIGNLLTAAMVYLLGAAADLFPRNSYLITISVMVIAIGGAVLLLAADWGWELVTGKRPRFVLGIALALLGIAIFLAYWTGSLTDRQEKLPAIILGALAVLSGSCTIAADCLQGRRDSGNPESQESE